MSKKKHYIIQNKQALPVASYKNKDSREKKVEVAEPITPTSIVRQGVVSKYDFLRNNFEGAYLGS